MFTNLKIGTRLAVAFGILLTLSAGIALLAVQSLGALNQTTEVIINNRYPQVVLATKVLLQVSENATAMRNMLLVDNNETLNSEISAIQSGEKRIADNLARLNTFLSSEIGRKAYTEIEALRAKYRSGQTAFMQLAASGGTMDASALLLTTLHRDQQNYTHRIKALIEDGGLIMEKSGKDAADQYRNKRMMILVLAGVASLFACGFAFWITRSITVPINDAVRHAKAVAGGNLTSQIKIRSADEIGQLLQALEDMNAGLCKIVREVRGGTEAIASASSQIAAGNLDLSSRTEQQASSLEETASAMEQLAATVSQNADNAHQAKLLAVSASDVATSSSKVVAQVVDTMGAITDSSRKIANIIGVIDGIAFQTNILALNAAVEAARAGEQGRGFAVVATEVRNLAQRSAAAAKDIKTLIDHSVESVNLGSKLAEQAGTTMHDVVASVGRVAGIVSEISSASQEQSAGLGQVNQVIAQMDEATQQNAALVEQAAAAAQSLQDQAANLAQLVSVFKLEPNQDAALEENAARVVPLVGRRLLSVKLIRQSPGFAGGLTKV